MGSVGHASTIMIAKLRWPCGNRLPDSLGSTLTDLHEDDDRGNADDNSQARQRLFRRRGRNNVAANIVEAQGQCMTGFLIVHHYTGFNLLLNFFAAFSFDKASTRLVAFDAAVDPISPRSLGKEKL